MAQAYFEVLAHMEQPVTVIGRSAKSAQQFSTRFDKEVVTGGLRSFLAITPDVPAQAIVAVDVNSLADTCEQLIRFGVKRILLEKPGALTLNKLHTLAELARASDTQVFIAYNRRFFASSLRAQQIIEEDGGVLSFDIELTEWAHKIAPLSLPENVKQRWIIANTSHVIDLAFFLGGEPESMQCFQRGSLDWHRSAAAITGAGVTRQGALFSYQGNWRSAGRWGLEISTAKRRLRLTPMETLSQQRVGTVNWQLVDIDDDADNTFKPGLFAQVTDFLKGDTSLLCDLTEQCQRLRWYEQIGGYSKTTQGDA